MNACSDKLAAAQNATEAGEVVRANASILPYSNVFKAKEAFTLSSGNIRFSAISNLLDSAAVGSVSKPVYDASTNLYYTVKVLDKATKADSVLIRQIGVTGKDEKDSDAKADSILNAIKGGASFKDIAKKYAQTGDSSWVVSSQFANAQLDDDNIKFINTIYSTSKGETVKVKFANGANVILQVIDQKDFKPMYNVAAVVKTLEFSNETFNNEYNKFSSFVSANRSVKELEDNAAKNGYTVYPIENFSSATHNIYNIKGTHDAVRWVFENAEVGDISDIYDCGDHNHLMVVALTGINEKGYYSIDKVKEFVKQQIVNDKKAEKLIAKLAGVNSIAAAKAKGAQIAPVNQITFASPVFVVTTGASEPALSGAVAATKQGQFSKHAVKGNAGVYLFQVTKKQSRGQKFDAKAMMQRLAQRNMQAAGNFMQELFINADIKDHRVNFF